MTNVLEGFNAFTPAIVSDETLSASAFPFLFMLKTISKLIMELSCVSFKSRPSMGALLCKGELATPERPNHQGYKMPFPYTIFFRVMKIKSLTSK